MTTITDEQVETLRSALTKLSNEVFGSLPLVEPLARQEMGNTNYNILMQRAEEARAALTAAAQPDPTIDPTKLNFSQVVNRIARVIDHNDAGSGGSRMDFAKAIAKGVFDLSEAMAVQAGKSSNILTHAVQYRRKDQIENFDPWHTMAAFDCESAASAYCRKQSSMSWEYRWICLEPDRVEPPLPAAEFRYDKDRRTLIPARPGYYWAKWLKAADDTHEGSELTPAIKWEIVQVNDNNVDDPNDDEHLSVSVPGVRETQWREDFQWGAFVAPIESPAPATLGRANDWQLVRAAALARQLCQLFDSAGESERTVKARFASAIFQLLHKDTPAHDLEYARCSQDYISYLREEAASPSQPTQSVEGDDYDRRGAISIQDPVLLVESLIQFGRSPDGSVERDLRHAISTITKELSKHKQARIDNGGKWIGAVKRAEKAEAELAEAKKVIKPFAKMANQLDSWQKSTCLDFQGSFASNDLRAARNWLDRNKS